MILLEKPKTDLWRFFDFAYANGNNPIAEWHDETLSDRGQELLNNLLKTNSKIEIPIKWTGSLRHLRGDMVGIWEVRFWDGAQQRLLGIFDGAKRAVFLVGCYHKGGRYTPEDALQTARKRKLLWKNGNCIKTNERQIRID